MGLNEYVVKMKHFKSVNAELISGFKYGILEAMLNLFYAGYVTSFKQSVGATLAPNDEICNSCILDERFVNELQEHVVPYMFDYIFNTNKLNCLQLEKIFHIDGIISLEDAKDCINYIMYEDIPSLVQMIYPLITKKISELNIQIHKSDIPMFNYMYQNGIWDENKTLECDEDSFCTRRVKYIAYNAAIGALYKISESNDSLSAHIGLYESLKLDENCDANRMRDIQFGIISNDMVGVGRTYFDDTIMKMDLWKMMQFLTSTTISESSYNTSVFNTLLHVSICQV